MTNKMDLIEAGQVIQLVADYFAVGRANVLNSWPSILVSYLGPELPESMLPIQKAKALLACNVGAEYYQATDESRAESIRAMATVIELEYITDIAFLSKLTDAKHTLEKLLQKLEASKRTTAGSSVSAMPKQLMDAIEFADKTIQALS